MINTFPTKFNDQRQNFICRVVTNSAGVQSFEVDWLTLRY